MKNFKRKAFTLVELLIVIAIIGILFVVLISKVDFATDKAKALGVQTDFRSYQFAIETVARENAGLSTLVNDEASGEEKYAALEAALNKNLDPKLRVEIDENGNIATEAKDPWKEEYLGVYLAPDADGTVKDRGAIVMYCKGSNLKLGTTSETVNGVVNVTVESGKEREGADDYSISTIYTYVNGYGEINTTTGGFSNDIGGNGVNNDSSEPSNKLEKVEIWMVMGSKAYNFADLLAEEYSATLNVHLVDALPETLSSLDEENMILHVYVVKGRGIAYTNLGRDLDGHLVPVEEPLTLGQTLFLQSNYDHGWTDDIYSETEDGVYCVRVSETVKSDKTEIVEIWLVEGGTVINYTDVLKTQGFVVNVHPVDALPKTLIPVDYENFTADVYIVESTGIGYANDGGTVMSFGQFISGQLDNLDFDKGWSDDIYLETEDGVYCVRVDTTEMVEVVELWFIGNQDPTNQGEELIEQGITFKTYLVDELPETPIQSDLANSKIIAYVLRSSGIAYVNVEGESKPFAEALLGENFAGLDRGWSENIYLETEMGYYCVCTLVKPKAPVATNGGFYDADGNLLADWDILVNDYNMSVSKNNASNEDYAPCNIIANHFPTTAKVVISDTVTRIGSYTFENCTGLTSIDIGSGVKQIGYSAFRGCTGLTGKLVIPDNVMYIGNYAFSDCTGLSSLDLGSGVTNIGFSAFEDCTGITGELIIPNSVESIGARAFWGCTNLTGKLVIPDGVTVLYNDTFPVWGELTSIVFGSGIKIIGQGAGSSAIGVQSISYITIKATTPPALPMTNGLGSLPNLVAVYVPAEYVEVYRIADGWSEYADKIQAIPTT